MWLGAGVGRARVAVSLVVRLGRPVQALMLENAPGRPVRLRIMKLARSAHLEELIAHALRALQPDDVWERASFNQAGPINDSPRRSRR